MATIRDQQTGLDFGGVHQIKNIPSGINGGDAVNKSQLDARLALKQNNVSGGSGIDIDGSIISVDLATAGSDYSSLVVGGTGYTSLNGTYARLPYQAYLDYVGTDLDLTFGGDYNVYYKDNGSGVWAIVARREIDGQEETSDGGVWMSVLTTFDPTTVTSTVNSFIPNYQAVSYDSVSNSDAQDENGFVSPSEGSYAFATTAYAAGSTPAGLLFDNSKLALDFANTVNSAASTKVFPSSVIKTYLDEQIIEAKDLSNHPFSNTIAQITGSPNNAQSMGEALAGEIDTLDGQVSALQTKDITHDAYIADNTSALGINQGEDVMPTPIGAAVSFTGSGGNVAGYIQTLGDSIGNVYSNIGNLLGLGQFDADFGTGFVILPNDADAKALFQATEAELQQIALGLGQYWSPVEAYSGTNITISNPSTDEFGGAVVSQGDRVLLTGQTASSQNGIYIFDTTSTEMVRASDADADAEFTPNKTVQVLDSSEEGISGATFAYTGIDSPTVGTNVLPFALKSKGVVGDNSITESKLGVVLAAKLNAKGNRYEDTGISVVADTPFVINHDLGYAVPNVTVYLNNSKADFDVDIIDSNNITITSGTSESNISIVVS